MVKKFLIMFKEKLRLYLKYLILRNKAERRILRDFSKEELELLTFLKLNIRESSSIIIDEDNTDGSIKIAKDKIEFILQRGRLIAVDAKSYMDIPVGELVQREIIYYINRVMRYRLSIFNKKCKKQIHTLITNFK